MEEVKKMESILNSIKKMLGITEDYDAFDEVIITHINSVLMNLTQLGVGPDEGFSIVDETDTWYDFIKEDPRLESIKSYIYLKVRLLFDPPISSALIDSMNRQISELEWRINVAAEDKTESVNREEENQNGK